MMTTTTKGSQSKRPATKAQRSVSHLCLTGSVMTGLLSLK